jgi:hypothetical protein
MIALVFFEVPEYLYSMMHVKFLFRLLIALFLPVFSFAQNDLEEKSLLDHKISLLVPQSFHVMTPAEYAIKYPNPKRKASLILTNKDLTVNLVVDYLQQYGLADEQVEPFKDMQLAAIQKSHPESAVIDNGMKTIAHKKIGFFKVLTQASDQKIFNYFLVTNLDGKVLLMTFNCGENVRAGWEGPMDKMVSSLKLLD